MSERSGSGWSDAGIAEEGDEPAFAIADRYEHVTVAGRGGMGEVVVVHDRRLGRDVAMKRIAPGGDATALAAQLVREAHVIAQLEHPAIVPIYDAGVSETGELYYTMRYVQGRSLAEALAASTPAERLALARHFLAACEAVAYAHNHGIVHRDLKPANIMVGAFGETQVLDWGLASLAAGGARGAGTPGYMSPEQAAGGAADLRSDVWALGVVLHELAVGGRPVVGRARGGGAGAPVELVAIAERATAIDPARRYVDAGDLAADVARYLDGRRVEAHAYSTLELARRLARRLRVPLAIGGGALVTGSLALALTFHRIDAARDRAQTAEARTHSALEESRATSSWALARHAVVELEHGAVADAELLAAHALVRGESPDARGVMAAAWASARPAHASTFALPGCTRVIPGTWTEALCADGAELALYDLTKGAARWRIPFEVRDATIVGAHVIGIAGTGELVVLSGATGVVEQRHAITASTGFVRAPIATRDGSLVAVTEGRVLTVIALPTGAPVLADRICGGEVIVAVAPAASHFVAICADGGLRTVATESIPLPSAPALANVYPTAAAITREGMLVVGGVRGDVMQVDLATGDATPAMNVAAGSIGSVVSYGAWTIIASESGGVGLWDLSARTELARLPRSFGTSVAVTDHGIVTGGARAGRVAFGSVIAPRVVTTPVGIGALAVSPDGTVVAAGRSDGHVVEWDRRTGALRHELALGAGVVKAVSYSPDGARLAATISVAGAGPRLFDRSTWTELALDPTPRATRRVAFTTTGDLVAVHFAPPTSRFTRDGQRIDLPTPEIFDVSATTSDLVLLGSDGTLWRLGDTLRAAGRSPGAKSVAAWPRTDRIATAHAAGIAIHAPDSAPHWLGGSGSEITDLAVSPDERYLLAARTDGTISVWRTSDDVLVATLRGHTQHVGQLAFASPDILVSAGWDGRVVTWNLAALSARPQALVTTVEAAWGTDLALTIDEPY